MLRWLCALAIGTLFLAGFAVAPARAETYRLRYEAAVLNVVVLGAANYEVATTPTRYVVRGSLRTSGLARMFDQTQITATSSGALSSRGVIWTRYDISHAYSGKFRRIRLSRSRAGVAAEISPVFRDLGETPVTPSQQASSYDPLSGIFALGRQVSSARACRGAVLVFDGKQHYRLTLSARSQGRFNGGGYSGPALNCTMTYAPISGFATDFNRSGIPPADIWFALQEGSTFSAPLRLTVQTPLGAARLDLRGYERTV
jgi:hypothetical protein